MKRLKSGLATGGLLALALAVSPAIPAGATSAASGDKGPAPESQSLKTVEQSKAASSAQALGLASGEQLTVKSVIADPSGATHVRYERTIDGLRVVGGDFVSHRDATGTVKSVTWNVRKSVTPATTTPKISKSAAQQAGLAAAKADSEKSTAGELVVYQGTKAPTLAYEVVTEGIKADQTPTRLHTIVDAVTGKTLTSWDDIKEGTGNGIFVGTVSLATSGSSGAYTMRDSHGNYTTDLNQATSGTGTTFTDADDVWGNGSQSSRQSAAVDAHHGAGKTYDHYNTQLGRAGIWNNATGARSRVHYGPELRQRLLGRHADDLRRRLGQRRPARRARRRRPRDEPRRHRERRRPQLLRRRRRPQRVDVRHLRHGRRVVRQQPVGHPRLPHRRGDQPQRQRDPAALHGQAEQGRRLEGLLELQPRRPRPALLERPAQPLVLPRLRRLGRQDDQRRQLQQPDLQLLDGDRHRPHQGREDLVPHALDLPHLVEHLRFGSHGRHHGGEGPLRRRLGRVHRGQQRDGGDLGARDHRDVRRHDPAAHRWLADQRRLRVGSDRLDRHGGPDHEQHGPPHPQRLVEALARRQRHDGLRERVADLRGAVDGHVADAHLLGPHRHGRDVDLVGLRQGDRLAQRDGVKSYSNLSTPTSSYVQVSIDLTAYKGTNVTLKFAATEDSSFQTSFVFDDVATSF